MPNHIYADKAKKRAQLALTGLLRLEDLGAVVTKTDGAQFVGALGDSLYFKLPSVTRARKYEFRTRTAPIVMDEIYTNEHAIVLDTHTYSGNKFTDEEETLDLESYGNEILAPQIRAVTQDLNYDIRAKLLNSTSLFKVNNLVANASDDVLEWALQTKAQMDAIGMPNDVRYLMVGSEAFNWLAQSDAVKQYDTSQALNVFRRGTFGIIAGLTVVDRPDLDPEAIFVVHPTWAVMANVAPVVPRGATWGVRRQQGGYGVRVIRDYDPMYLSDRSVVSTFTGITVIRDEVELHTASTAASDNSTYGDNAKAGDIRFDFSTKKLKLTGKSVRAASGEFYSGS